MDVDALCAHLMSDAARMHKEADDMIELAHMIQRYQALPVLLDDMLSLSLKKITTVKESLPVRDIQEAS